MASDHFVPRRDNCQKGVSHLAKVDPSRISSDNLRRARVNLNHRGQFTGVPQPYTEGDDLLLKLEDPVLSKPTLADFEITRPVPEYRYTYDVIKTNDCEEYGGRNDPGQMLIYPGEVLVRKAVPISIFGQSVFYDKDDYFLENNLPFLSEATIEKFKYKECIYVKKLGVADPEEREEGFVPRRCIEAHDSDNCHFIFPGVTLEDRLYGGPRICLP